MIRYQGNKVKKYFYFLLVILFTANVFGCTKQIGNDSVTDRKIQEDGKESIYKRLYHKVKRYVNMYQRNTAIFITGKAQFACRPFKCTKKY